MTAPLMTAEEFAATHARIRAELVRGVVVPYEPSWAVCGKICARVVTIIGNQVDGIQDGPDGVDPLGIKGRNGFPDSTPVAVP